MKKKLLAVGLFLMTFIGFTSAQYCPTPVGRTNVGLNSGFSNFGGLSSTNSLSRVVYDFAYTLDRGYRSGDLTRQEVFRLENDLNRLNRSIERAAWDRRITNVEWTMIEFDIRNLQRDLRREWNDDDRRLG